MNRLRSRFLLGILLGLSAAALSRAQIGTAVSNWTVPPYARFSGSAGLTTMVDITEAAVFVAVTPCRVVDTRGPVGPFGGPALNTNVARTFDVNNGPCAGIPFPGAYSLSIGAILPPADGFLTAWPTGSAQPTISQLNLIAGEVVANAAIVPAGTDGAINVLVNIGPTHIYIDINGYFMDEGVLSELNPGRNFILRGSTADSFWFAYNQDTTTVSETTSSLQAYMNTPQNGPSALIGRMARPSGANFGVTGQNASASLGAAGVRGLDEATAPPAGLTTLMRAGVLGVSRDRVGVYGVTQLGSGGGGVRGEQRNTNGTLASGGVLGYSGTVGVFYINGLGGTGNKMFIEPHPTDPSKAIKYVSLEGNEAGTYFRGRGKFEHGIATIDVPEDFRMVTHEEGLGIQVTPIGEMATFAVVRIGLDRIVVRASRNVEFFYTVNGVRRAYPEWNPIQENDRFFVPESANASLPTYLAPDELRRLIANGTYNADGTVNMETARRLGWMRMWEAESVGRVD